MLAMGYVHPHDSGLSELTSPGTEKVELVKNVIVNLALNIESGRSDHEWQNLPIEKYLQKDEEVKAVSIFRSGYVTTPLLHQ